MNMNESKLYSALLKTQSMQKADRQRGTAGRTTGNLAHDDSAQPAPEKSDEKTEQVTAERQPDPRQDQKEKPTLTMAESDQVDWLLVDDELRPDADPVDPELEGPASFSASGDEEDRGWPPTIYDGSSALQQINNPRPWSQSQLRRRQIIYPGMPNQAILNAYRELRINLRNLSGSANFSVLMSSLSRETESVLSAFNLAASFALDAHSSALLVDCDPYHSNLQRLVSTPMQKGITDFVSDPSLSVQDVIYPSGLDRLSVIPAGQKAKSAVELFSSRRMQELMHELLSRYDDRYIVINAPSYRLNTEARILERYAQHAVLTVPFGELTGDEILASVSTMNGEKFAGLVYQE